MLRRNLVGDADCSLGGPCGLFSHAPAASPSGDSLCSEPPIPDSIVRLRWHALPKPPSFLVIVLMLACLCPAAVAGVNSSKTISSATQANGQALLRAGVRLVQQKRIDEAIQTFKQGLRQDPRNAVLLNALGAAYSLENDAKEADRDFLAALRIDPQFAPARRNLAISYFNDGFLDLASREFKVLYQNRENHSVASLFLGMIAAKRAEYPRAIQFFDESENLIYRYPESILSFAGALYHTRQNAKSERILARLGDAPSVSTNGWLQAGVLYSYLGQYPQALDAFRRGLQKNPQGLKINHQEACFLSKIGRSNQGRRILQKFVDQYRVDGSLNALGHIAENAGDIDLALESFRKAIELAPNSEECYLDFSTLCMRYKNNALALDVIKAGLARLPRSYRLTVQEGAILGNLGRQKDAEEAFQSAIRLRSDNREAILGLAIAETHADQFNVALKTLATGVQKFPNDFNLRYYYAFALFRLAQRDGTTAQVAKKAKQATEKSIQLNPASAGAYYLLSKWNAIEENPQLAEENLETCLRLNPKYLPAKYQLALLYLKTGKRQQGKSLLREVKQEQAVEFRAEQTRPRIVLAKH